MLEMDVDISCSTCAKEYQDNNPPRLLTCGHTYCQNCIASLFSQITAQSFTCPEDQSIIAKPSSVEKFPKNIALMKLIEANKKNSSNNSSRQLKDAIFDVSKINRQDQCQQDQDAKQLISVIQKGSLRKESQLLTDDLPAIQLKNTEIQLPPNAHQAKPKQKKEETQVCLLHQRPIQVVCMIDFQRLCSKCALFGQHKNHEFKSLEQIDRQNKKFYQQIINVFEQKQKLMDHITNKTIQNEIISVLAIKTANFKKQIAQRFKKLAEELVKTERNIYRKLQQANSIVKKRVQTSLQVDKQLLDYYESWVSKALLMIKQTEKLPQEAQIKFYLNGSQIFKEGKEILSQLQKTQDNSQLQTLKIVQEFTIKFHQSDYYESLKNLVYVFEQGKEDQQKRIDATCRLKQNEATFASKQKCENSKKNQILKHQSDQSLLEFGQVQTESLVGSMSHSQILNESFISTKDQIITKNKEHPGRALVKKNKSTFTVKQKLVSNKDILANSSTLSRDDIKKKLRTFKVPEKYEKVLQGIIADSLEIIDLTNAQLGDTQVLKILDLMKFNTRAKALKLIRNKLTDEGVASMLPFFSNLVTINLSQNQLTQNTLSMLADNKGNMPLLKNVVLSQTKINERKSKPIIQKLKKLQVCVSV